MQEASEKAHITFDGHQIYLSTKPNTSVEDKKALLMAWYREQFKQIVPELLEKWQPIIKVDVVSWGIKAMKTRWGSCNIRQKRIWLNLNLMMKPFSCIEYVFVHEMVHLLEPSHNKRFYALMSQFLPEWQDCKRLLR